MEPKRQMIQRSKNSINSYAKNSHSYGYVFVCAFIGNWKNYIPLVTNKNLKLHDFGHFQRKISLIALDIIEYKWYHHGVLYTNL